MLQDSGDHKTEDTSLVLTCKKCGSELHEDQKVCIACGTRTIRGDGFDYSVEKWRPSRRIKIAAGVVVFAWIVVMVANALRITPPSEVNKEWFEAMYTHNMKVATPMVTENFTKFLSDRNWNLGDLSALWNGEVIGSSAKPSYGKPVMTGERNATIPITLNYPDGQVRVITIDLIKDGRQWMIEAYN